jgi:hypothetical protein
MIEENRKTANYDEPFETHIQQMLDREDLRECARMNWYVGREPTMSLHNMSLEDDDRVLSVLWEYEARLKGGSQK